MNVIICRAALLLFALASAVGAAGTGLAWDQHLLVREGALDDDHVEATFTFRNSGSDKLTVTRIESSCGCLLTSLEKKQYGPGEGGELKALVDVSDQEGTQEKIVRVWTSSGTEPDVLKLRVTMPRWLELSPPAVWWLVGSEPHGRQIEIAPGSGVRVSQVTSSDPLMAVTVVSNSDGEPTRLVISPESTVRPLRARITVVVESATGRRRTFGVPATVR